MLCEVAGVPLAGRCYRSSLFDDQATPLREHGSAAVDDHGADCSTVLANPDWAIYYRVS